MSKAAFLKRVRAPLTKEEARFILWALNQIDTGRSKRKYKLAGSVAGKMMEIVEPFVAKETPCPEQDGKLPCEFTPDLEYDSTGQTINCTHCGRTQEEAIS